MKHKILKLPFTLYDSDTLVKIAEQKLDLLKQRMDENTKPNLNPKLVELAVRKSAAKMGGDCRQVFSTVKSMIAAECKEQGSARNALLGSFSSRGDVIRATLESLPLHTQITMVAIVKEAQKESSEANITFYSIYFSYKSICLKFHIKCLPEESIKRSLDVLMATGMISSSTDSKNSSSKRARTTFRSPGRLAATIGDCKTYTTEVTKEVLDYVTENEADILQRLVLLCKSR